MFDSMVDFSMWSYVIDAENAASTIRPLYPADIEAFVLSYSE